MTTLKLRKDEIIEELGIEPASFPTYAGPLLNLANRFSGATRPAVVGQMSDLIEQCDAECLEDWEEWYLTQHPEAIEQAKELIKTEGAAVPNCPFQP